MSRWQPPQFVSTTKLLLNNNQCSFGNLLNLFQQLKIFLTTRWRWQPSGNCVAKDQHESLWMNKSFDVCITWQLCAQKTATWATVVMHGGITWHLGNGRIIFPVRQLSLPQAQTHKFISTPKVLLNNNRCSAGKLINLSRLQKCW